MGKCNIFRYALQRRKQYGLLDLNNSGKAVRTTQVEMNKTLACSKCTLAQHVYLCILINNNPDIAALRKCARIRPKTVLLILALVAFSIKTFCARKTNSISSLLPSLLPLLHYCTLPTNWSPISILWVSRRGGEGQRSFAMTSQKTPHSPPSENGKVKPGGAWLRTTVAGETVTRYISKPKRIPSGRPTVVKSP